MDIHNELRLREIQRNKLKLEEDAKLLLSQGHTCIIFVKTFFKKV